MKPSFSDAARSRWTMPCVLVVLAVAVLLAYGRTFSAPFVFDDLTSIKSNPTIRALWPLGPVLATPRGTGDTVEGRPLLNLSFALNYAIDGLEPRGYRLTNLLIHLGAAALLFALLRRTLTLPSQAARWGNATTPLAAACALVWMLHPLQTAAVTYVVQRAESLMAFCFLLTLYSFVRSIDARHPWRWRVLAVAACFAGAATKEVMAVAPLVVFLYDRTFIAGSFSAAWHQRWLMHTTLASSWLLLAVLLASDSHRANTAGFDTAVSPWHYALTQIGAVVHYLRLSAWPAPLAFDYGTAVVTNFTVVAFPAALLLALLAAVGLALARWPAAGFLGATFFLVLAPSSSVVPVATQTVAEHRMYLPLAAIVVLVLGTTTRWFRWRPVVGVTVCLIAPVFAFLTHQRNHDYTSAVALWRDTTIKRPDNARAFVQLGVALMQSDDDAGAQEAFSTALRLDPENSEAHTNLGVLHLRAHRIADAIAAHAAAVELRPDSAAARANLAQALLDCGRKADALLQFEAALQLDPDLPELEHRLGVVLLELDRAAEAVAHLEHAVRQAPGDAAAHYNLANALIATRRMPEAIGQLESAVRLDPDHVAAHGNLGNLLLLARRPAEAVSHFEFVVRHQPDSPAAHTNLALALLLAREQVRAAEYLREALRLDPTYAPARETLNRLEAAR